MHERLGQLLRTVRTAGLGPGGPVHTSVGESLRRAFLLGLVIWNVVLVGVMVVADPRWPTGVLVLIHLALVGVAAAALRGLVRFDVTLVLGYAAWAVDYLAATSPDDVITLAACWLGNLLYAAGSIALQTRARTWLTVVGPVTVVGLIVAASPVWTLDVASAVVVTALAVAAAARLAMPSLWRLAGEADANVEALEHEHRARAVARRAGSQAAEDARLVHDTVINTMGAIATRGDAAGRTDVVRERCRRDLGVVEGILAGRRRAGRRLAQIGETAEDVHVDRAGLSAAALAELDRQLDPVVADAVVGAAEEAVRNVGKHAGVDRCTVTVARSTTHVTVTVTDDGVGFDPSEHAGHGLTESIRTRVQAAGGEVHISSTAAGSTVVITGPLRRDASAAETVAETDVDGTALRIARRACWLLGVSLVGVGVVIELVNRPGQLTWTYAMLGLVAACIVLSRLAVRGRDTLPRPVAALLVAALPVGFVAATAGIDFGRTEVLTFQALGFVPVLLILFATSTVRWAVAAETALVLTAAVLAVVMWQVDDEYGAIIAVCAAPAVGLGVGWWGFQRLVLRVVAASEDARREASAIGLEVAARTEIAQARERWGTAGLERAAGLLRGIADAGLDPTDPAVREACAVEEQYLRQLLLISPTAYRMSAWLAHALATAREHDVRLTVRSGDQDAPDHDSAGALGAFVVDAVARVPSGSDVTVSWLPTSAGPRLSILGPRTTGDGADGADADLPATWTLDRTPLAELELVEVVVPGAAPARP